MTNPRPFRFGAHANVVATASFITGHNQGGGREKIADALETPVDVLFDENGMPKIAE